MSSEEYQLLRSSILLATVFAAAKQLEDPQPTTVNLHDVYGWQRMESSKSAKRVRAALTHWATTLTRGGTDDRLLAVVVGEFSAAGLETLVVRSSPSSSQLDARDVHAHNPTDADLSALESTLVSFLDKDHKFAKDIDRARTTPFNKYAGEVLAAIQIASRLRPAYPGIGHALQGYVVVHCLPKLTLRVSSFACLFPDLYPKLANAWAPSPDEFSADVKITAPPDLLTAAFRSSDPAPLTAANAAAWWRLLCQVAHLLVRFVKGAATEPNIAEIVHACTLLQDLVKFAPSSLWASHSLDLLLIPKVNEGSEEREKIEDEEMRDGNVTDAADTLLGTSPDIRPTTVKTN
ncbi:hypothetical protein B0H14DRAFT_1318992 [Mycena olivaceomarginata]|nr:hypothetical protein B0H14DRAFT_1318992 [Mycena olivaceomarginata]